MASRLPSRGLEEVLRDLGSLPPADRIGQVALVGAGPGDPELLTLRAVKALHRADAVVYDHLVSEEVLRLAPRDAELIYAGKQASRHSLSQDEINKLLVALARRGMRVARLKGGDPFVFGRGGEEVEFLHRHGVPFEVIPGVTSASGAACYAGIPLTHRECAQSVVFVTGHRKKGGCDLDWEMLARPRQTLVIYMGLATVAEISRGLIAHGMRADMPAAIVERATTAEQRVVVTTVSGLAQAVALHKLAPPSLIVVGEVVNLREQLGQFDNAAPAPNRPRVSLS